MVAQLIEAAMPAMRELSATTGESCHLSVLEGMEIVILARVESSHPVRLVVELGGRFSALTTVSGRMMLAAKEPPVRRELLESAPEVRQPKPGARRTLIQKIENAASDGFSTAQDETVTGVVDEPRWPSGIHPGESPPPSRLQPSPRKAGAAVRRISGRLSKSALERFVPGWAFKRARHQSL